MQFEAAQACLREVAAPGPLDRVDQVLGSREIVVKPTGPQVSSIPGIFGATVMGDGSVVIILDVAPLVRRLFEAGFDAIDQLLRTMGA